MILKPQTKQDLSIVKGSCWIAWRIGYKFVRTDPHRRTIKLYAKSLLCALGASTLVVVVDDVYFPCFYYNNAL